LRPHREPYRIEKEIYEIKNKKVIVIHNYGHGGNGISLSKGTTIDAVNLLLKELNKSKL
jgi:D-aspartate oxidase